MSRPLAKYRLFIAAAFGSAFAVVALPAHAGPMTPTLPVFLPVGDAAKPPADWAGYCARYSGECDAHPAAVRTLDLNQDNWSLLLAVNAWANSAIKPETDADHWGVADRWDDPRDGYGDCEDIAILKRQVLIALGIPAETLLLTVVWDKNSQGHAVLTAHAAQGDYVLDNMNPDVLLWSQTGYDFVKRQSQTDLNHWVYIDGLTWPKQMTIACGSTSCDVKPCEGNQCGKKIASVGSLRDQWAFP